MIPIPWFKVALVAGAVSLAAGGVWFVRDYVADAQATRDALAQAEIALLQKDAALELRAVELGLEKHYRDRHLELVESTQSQINAIRNENREAVAAVELRMRAATEAGRADLNARSRERWREVYDAIEESSDWDRAGVYDRPGAVRPAAE